MSAPAISENKMAAAGDVISVVVKWSGKEYPFEDLPALITVKDLKQAIYEKTMVRPDRQKLLGLKYKGYCYCC